MVVKYRAGSDEICFIFIIVTKCVVLYTEPVFPQIIEIEIELYVQLVIGIKILTSRL